MQNYAFTNAGNLIFKNNATSLGLSQLSYSNGAAYGDLDNDGDEDLVVNNINSKNFVYQNNAISNSGNHFLKVRFMGSEKNLFGIGAEVRIKTKDGIQVLQNYNTRGFQSSIEPCLLFGIGKTTVIDSLQVTWPDGKVQVMVNVKTDQAITLKNNEAAIVPNIANVKPEPIFEEVGTKLIDGAAIHHEDRYNDFNDEILLTRMLSTEGPRLIKGDVNKDKLTDFILLGAAGDPDKLFVQKPDGSFHFQSNPAFTKDAGFESTCGALFDYDHDGDADLIIGSGGNEPRMPKINFMVRLYSMMETEIFHQHLQPSLP